MALSVWTLRAAGIDSADNAARPQRIGVSFSDSFFLMTLRSAIAANVVPAPDPLFCCRPALDDAGSKLLEANNCDRSRLRFRRINFVLPAAESRAY